MKQAASLLLLRHPDAPQVLWVRRAERTRFLSGFHAFPGGMAEPGDADLRATAARETAEEVGIAVDVDQLAPLETWISPPYLGPQFETHYFQAWADGTPTLNEELAAAEWITPAAALRRWRDNRALLVPPTLSLLRRLAGAAPAAPDGPPDTSFFRPHIQLFPVRTPTLPPATHTNCYIVGEDVLAVVDPASPYPDEVARLDAALDARGARVRAILLTHHHHDHVGGAAHLSERLGVPILAHPETARRVAFPVHGFLDEGDRVQLGRHHLDVLFTPGHAPGHLCFVDGASRSAIVGDMVAGLGTILIEPGDGDMAAYLQHLGRLRDRAPSCLMPSHGQTIGGAVAYLEHYIAHRLGREAKVVDALRPATQTLEALVETVYDDAPPIARMGPGGGLAGLSLRSHLDKLAREGRARAVEGGWVSAGG